MKNRNIALAATFAVVCLFAAAQSVQAQTPFVSSQQSVPLIEPARLHALMNAGIRVYILDVRQPEEFNRGHIRGAVLMPLGTLSSSYTTLPKTGKLVVYCHSGRRSAQAVQFLLQHGYGNAVSLSGGYTAWTRAKFQK
jgi:rhodanese-related sulfurtransferase